MAENEQITASQATPSQGANTGTQGGSKASAKKPIAILIVILIVVGFVLLFIYLTRVGNLGKKSSVSTDVNQQTEQTEEAALASPATQEQVRESLSQIIVRPNENLPAGWPESLPIGEEYTINVPNGTQETGSFNIQLFSKKQLLGEKAAFKTLLTSNGWEVTDESTTAIKSEVLQFKKDNLVGGLEMNAIEKDPHFTSIVIFIVAQ